MIKWATGLLNTILVLKKVCNSVITYEFLVIMNYTSQKEPKFY